MPTCLQCGANVEPGEASCVACGLPIPTTALPADAASTASVRLAPAPDAVGTPGDPSAAPAAAASSPDGDAAQRTAVPNTLVRTLLIGAGAVALVAGLVWAYFTFFAGVGVPDLTGLTEPDAASVLTASDLKPGGTTRAYSETVAKGAVCSQDPGGDVKAPRGSAVAMVISDGRQPVPVPAVVNKSLTDAQATLTAAGFTARVVQKSSNTKKGTVLSQSLAGGSMVQPGASVTLTVSSGVTMVTVPNAVSAAINHDYTSGSPLEDQARQVVSSVLSRAGLKMKLVLGPSTDASYQKPRAGAKVPRGSTVTVYLGIGD